MKKINMPIKPIEDKINNVKKNLKESEMGYDIVEDIKKDKENISLYKMCILNNLETSQYPTNIPFFLEGPVAGISPCYRGRNGSLLFIG